jgi:hypothetical protein
MADGWPLTPRVEYACAPRLGDVPVSLRQILSINRQRASAFWLSRSTVANREPTRSAFVWGQPAPLLQGVFSMHLDRSPGDGGEEPVRGFVPSHTFTLSPTCWTTSRPVWPDG